MNFIIRNLGWILLIIFFVFMLYLISNQNNAEKIDDMKTTMLETGALISTGTEDSLSDTGVTDLTIDKLVEVEGVNLVEDTNDTMVEVNTEVDTIKLNSREELDVDVSDVDAAMLEEPGAETGSTGGFVQSIRNFFTVKKSNNLDENNAEITLSGGVDEDLIQKVEDELETTEEEINEGEGEGDMLESEIITDDTEEVGEDTMSIFDKIKDSITIKKSDEDSDVQTDEENSEMGEENLINDAKEMTKIAAQQTQGKVYEVAIHSLRLNNAWFTEKLGVVYMGDSLEQLTATNRYGCFQVKVLKSKDSTNNGKIAWACEYYMKGHESSLYKYEAAAHEYNRNLYTKKVVQASVVKKAVTTPNVKKTEVGTMYSVNTHSLKLNNEYFNKTLGYLLEGDKVEQITEVNNYGCFKASVFDSSNTLGQTNGKVGWVCQKYLK